MILKTKNLKKKPTSSRLKRTSTKQERKPFIDSEELPASYNKDNLTLVARDPHWIYAHWEITQSSADKIRQNIGQDFDGSTLTLRMYDITLKNFDGNNANSWFDTDINFGANNWYINLWNDNATYCCAVGIRTRNGDFHPIVRSNFVTTPSANSSWRRDMIWMDVPPSKEEAKRPRARRPFVLVGKAPSHQPTKGKKWRQRIHLTAADIRAYYYNLFPLLRVLKKNRFFSGQKWGSKKLSQKDLEMSVLDSGFLPAGQYYKKFKLGASEEFQREWAGGASEQQKIGAVEERTTTTSITRPKTIYSP